MLSVFSLDIVLSVFSLVIVLSVFSLVILLSVSLRPTASEYPFDIFKFLEDFFIVKDKYSQTCV